MATLGEEDPRLFSYKARSAASNRSSDDSPASCSFQPTENSTGMCRPPDFNLATHQAITHRVPLAPTPTTLRATTLLPVSQHQYLWLPPAGLGCFSVF